MKNDFCDAQTHMHKSGGREPAVVRVTHLQRRAFLSERDARVALARLAYASRSWSRERVPLLMRVSDRRVRYVWHGRLTPTAPGARRRSAKNDDIRGTKTHGQERRASARRGLLTPVQLRTFATVGLRQPLLVHDVMFHREIATSAVYRVRRRSGFGDQRAGRLSAYQASILVMTRPPMSVSRKSRPWKR